MRKRLLPVAALMVLAALGGCSSEPSEWDRLILKARQAEWFSNECFRDTMLVPVEHSGNCLAAVRILRSDPIPDTCNESAGLHCRQVALRFERAIYSYWRAIAQSLFVYGEPKAFDPASRGTGFGIAQFYDVDLLTQVFQECLADEARQQAMNLDLNRFAAEVAFQPATIVKRRELAEGQKCIKEQPFDNNAAWLDS